MYNLWIIICIIYGCLYVLFMDDYMYNFSPCVYLYCCHDSTVTPLLTSLGIFDDQWPPYCSSVEFDLFENNAKEKFVCVSYCDQVSK